MHHEIMTLRTLAKHYRDNHVVLLQLRSLVSPQRRISGRERAEHFRQNDHLVYEQGSGREAKRQRSGVGKWKKINFSIPSALSSSSPPLIHLNFIMV